MVTYTHPSMNRLRTLFLLLTLLGFASRLMGQARAVTLEQAVETALQNNPGLKAQVAETSAAKYQKRTSVDIPKTQVLWMNGQYNSLNKDNNLTFTQSLPFPTTFAAQSRLGEMRIESSRLKEAVSRNELVYQVRTVYQNLLYLYAQEVLFKKQDSLFTELVRITSLQMATGEGTLLQKTAAETRYNEVQNLLRQNAADRLTYEARLRVLLHAPDPVTTVVQPLVPLSTPLMNDSAQVAQNPTLAYQRSVTEMALQEKKVESNRALPDLTLGYFTQSLVGFQTQPDGTDRYFSSQDRFTGFTVGLAIPIWFVPAHARVKTAGARSDASRFQTQYIERQLQGDWHQAVQQFEKHRNSLTYYQRSALPNADLLLTQSGVSLRAGEISQAEYRLNVQQALGIQEGYLQTVLLYNQSILTLEFLSGTYSKN